MSTELGCDIDPSAAPVVAEVAAGSLFLSAASGFNEIGFATETVELPHRCGDGRRTGGESCDGEDFGGTSCPQVFPGTAGRLSCVDDCTGIDTSACAPLAELRPTNVGTSPATAIITTFPVVGGAVSPNRECFAFEMSASETARVTTLRPDGSCAVVFPQLFAPNGNGMQVVPLRRARPCTFEVQAGDAGTYAVCLADTHGDVILDVDTTPPPCGDGIAEDNEECDVLDLRGHDCFDVFGGSGHLACTPSCTFDPASCAPLVTNEQEPNDDVASAPLIAGRIDGLIGGSDVDCFQTGAPAGTELVATIVDDFGNCLQTTSSTLFFPDGSSVLESPCGADLDITQSGSVFCLSASSSPQFPYHLDIEAKNPCGNGRIDFDEECDDGNLVDGDGCDHNCKREDCENAQIAVIGENSGDTSQNAAVLHFSGACSIEDSEIGPQNIWSFTPPQSGTLLVALTHTTGLQSLDARLLCNLEDVACASSFFMSPTSFSLPVTAGEDVTLVLSSFNLNSTGPYAFTLSLQ
jgi:cysteine-rich repeat protein